MRPAKSLWSALLGLLGLVAACSKAPAAPQTGLMVIISSNLGPSEFDSIEVQVSQEMAPGQWRTWMDRRSPVPDETKLPATVLIEAGTSADQDVLIRAIAFHLGAPVVLREVQIQAPNDRLAELRLVLAQSCKGQVSTTGAEGQAVSTCPNPNESCQPETGLCGSEVVANPSALPTYVQGDEKLDAGSGTATSPDAGGAAESAPGADASDVTAAASDDSGLSSTDDSTAPTDGARGDVEGASSGTDAAMVAIQPDAAIDGPPDAVAPNATGACKTEGTELCDGFESGSIDSKIWGMHATAGAALTVDTVRPFSGKYALHVSLVPGQMNTAQITDAVTFPAKNNTFYTRVFAYFSPDLPADNMGGFHMAYLLATGNNDLGYVEAGLGSAGNWQYLGYSEYFGAGPKTPTDPTAHDHGATFTEFGPDSLTRVVPRTWICLELMQGGDATTTMRRVWVDGVELPEQLSNYTGRNPPTFDLMSICVLQYHLTPILSDVWFDDIRVSSSRIGCNVP